MQLKKKLMTTKKNFSFCILPDRIYLKLAWFLDQLQVPTWSCQVSLSRKISETSREKPSNRLLTHGTSLNYNLYIYIYNRLLRITFFLGEIVLAFLVRLKNSKLHIQNSIIGSGSLYITDMKNGHLAQCCPSIYYGLTKLEIPSQTQLILRQYFIMFFE